MNTPDTTFEKGKNVKDVSLKYVLNIDTAQKVAKVIYDISDLSGVAITSMDSVLAFIGIDCPEHPLAGMPIVSSDTAEVLRTGKIKTVHDRGGLKCTKDCECPIESTVIAPLTIDDEIIGAVKLYHPSKDDMPEYVTRLAVGAAKLLSMQVELAEKEHQKKLMTEAQLDALRARINPHFLFNTINTISVLVRTEPEKARKLLLNLSAYFRNSLQTSKHIIPIYQEFENINNYIEIERARFGDKINVEIIYEPEIKNAVVPILSIQPLVENAVIHGLNPKEGYGKITITAKAYGENKIEVCVMDNGVGIKDEVLPLVKEFKYSSGTGAGVGFSNVNSRLKLIYGEESGIKIESKYREGTKVSFIIKKCILDSEESEYNA